MRILSRLMIRNTLWPVDHKGMTSDTCKPNNSTLELASIPGFCRRNRKKHVARARIDHSAKPVMTTRGSKTASKTISAAVQSMENVDCWGPGSKNRAQPMGSCRRTALQTGPKIDEGPKQLLRAQALRFSAYANFGPGRGFQDVELRGACPENPVLPIRTASGSKTTSVSLHSTAYRT